MKHVIDAPLPDNPRNLMRRAGYGETPGYKGEISYQKRVTTERFPRFHAYVQTTDNGGMRINLHLDQKQASYASGAAHGGEYEGPLVEQEMQRLVSFIASLRTPSTPSNSSSSSSSSKSSSSSSSSKSFWNFLRGK